MSIAATQDYSYMPDGALQQALQFAQRSNDTPKFLGLMAEISRRKQMRTAAQGQQAGQEAAQQPTTVADKVMSGIANLTSGDHSYANGGIVAFAQGDLIDAKGDPYTHLWHAEGSGDTNTPYLESVSKALGFPIEVIKRVIGAPNQKDYGQKQRRPAAAATPAPVSAPMYTPTTPGVVPAEAGVTEKLLPREERRPSGPARPAPAAAPVAPPAAPAPTDITVEATDTPEQLAVKRAALAAKDDAGVSAVYKRMADRDAAKQAKMAVETQDKEGILGFKMSPAVREALLRAGIGAMTSKSTTALGGIGEGLAAGAEAYKAGEKSRLSRQDLLDEAADKRALSEIAAKQGNLDRAAKLQADADTLKMHAQNFGAKKAELTQRERHQLQQEQIAREQMAKQLEVARINASSANRATDADKYIAAAMKEDPKLSYTQAYDKYALGKGAPRSMDTLHSAWSRSAALQERFPNFNDYYKMMSSTDASGVGALPADFVSQFKVTPK